MTMSPSSSASIASTPESARQSGPAPRPDPTRPSGRSSRHEVGFWLIAAAFLTAMAFSTVPAPLYPIYQRRDGFSTFTITIIFAVYALGVIVSLLLAGHISDWVGRKRILLPALALEIVAAVLFLTWPALPGLIVARLVTGLGVGMITATATAHLAELHVASRPEAGRGRFEVVSTAVNIGGLGVGTLIAGALAQFVTGPLRTPYIVFIILLLLSMLAVAAAPETTVAPEHRPTYHPQRIRVVPGERIGYVAATGAAFTAFSVLGVFTSVAPGFVAGTLHHPARLLAGTIVFVVFGASALAQTATNRMTLTQRSASGLLGEALGLVVLAFGVHDANLAAFLIGGAIAGAGAGVLFKSAIGTIVAMSAPNVRGEALAGLFLIGYIGLALPALGLGIASRYLSEVTAMLWFTAILLVLLALVGGLTRAARHSARQPIRPAPGAP
jgi:MFS family permease